jgi:Domain of unknown function (DUF4440)
MTKRGVLALGTVFVLLLAIGAAHAARTPQARAHDDRSVKAEIRRTELARLSALVAGDIPTARKFFTADFRGINPIGISATREEFMDGMAAGAPDFLAQAPTMPIDVEVFGRQALVRYQVNIELTIAGFHLEHLMWETLLYRKNQDHWRVSWEQTTAVPNDIGLVLQALQKP